MYYRLERLRETVEVKVSWVCETPLYSYLMRMRRPGDRHTHFDLVTRRMAWTVFDYCRCLVYEKRRQGLRRFVWSRSV